MHILFLYIPNASHRDLKWWADFNLQTAAKSDIDQLREEIRGVYSQRTKLSVESDFTSRQLKAYPFQFQIESVTLDSESRAVSKLRPIVQKALALHAFDSLPKAENVYGGFHGELAEDPTLHYAKTHIDSLLPAAVGELQDLHVSQMWMDRRGNYVAIISSNDSVTAAHYTAHHPFYFGNMDKPDMYQFYSKSEQYVRSKWLNNGAEINGCRFKDLKLEIYASKPDQLDRTLVVQLDKSGTLHLTSPENSTCLREANFQERAVLTNRLRSGTITLHNMPETRQVMHIYKLDHSNTYIYIDAIVGSRSPESYRMFMGAPGHMQPVEILQIERIDSITTEMDNFAKFTNASIDGGAIIHTTIGTLYALTKSGVSNRPFWEENSNKTYLNRLVLRPSSKLIRFLQQLGIDLNRLREKPYQSPCEYLLRKMPILRLVS